MPGLNMVYWVSAALPPIGAPAQPTQLLDHRLELVQVGLVLPLVLDLFLDTLEDAHGRRIVVDLAARAEGSGDDVGGGDEVVRETVVEPALELEHVVDRGEEGVVPRVEGLERLGLVLVRAALERDAARVGGRGLVGSPAGRGCGAAKQREGEAERVSAAGSMMNMDLSARPGRGPPRRDAPTAGALTALAAGRADRAMARVMLNMVCARGGREGESERVEMVECAECAMLPDEGAVNEHLALFAV